MKAEAYMSHAEALALSRARRLCDAIVKRARSGDEWQDGVIFKAAETAERAMFDLLNTLDSYGHNDHAGAAIESYHIAPPGSVAPDA
jgi:hypothetical protein